MDGRMMEAMVTAHDRLLRILVGITLFCFVLPLGAERHAVSSRAALGTSRYSFSVSPSLDIPIAGDRDLFGVGGGATARATMRLAEMPMVYPLAEIGYRFATVEADTGLHAVSAGVGSALRFYLQPRFAAVGSLSGGYELAFLQPTIFSDETESGGSGYVDAFAGVTYEISPRIGVTGGLSYRNRLGLSQAISVGAQLSYHLPSRVRRPVDILEVTVPTIYPSLHQHYGIEPPGTVRIRNAERFPITELDIAFLIPGAGGEATPFRVPGTLAPGELVVLPLPLVLGESALLNAESQQVIAQLRISFTLYGDRETVEGNVPVTLAIGNAIVWDDDRKAAAFVTHRSPALMHFASGAVAHSSGTEYGAVHLNMRTAMALYAAIVNHGVVYSRDPDSPFTEALREQLVEDHIRFPVQTLQSRAGDCDDLSVLYTAMLEAVGVPAAFVTVPGHIFAAFSLGIPMNEASRFFTTAGDIIEYDGEAWVPVEITDLSGGFLRAWSSGAAQWRQYSAEGSAGFIRVRDAWQLFPPAADVVSTTAVIEAPRAVRDHYLSEMRLLVSREMEPRAQVLRERLSRSPRDVVTRNRLAVLYARYGLIDQAERQLREALRSGFHTDAAVNLANVLYLQGRHAEAAESYRTVLREEPSHGPALLGLSRSLFAQGSPTEGGSYYARLQSEDPALAAQFAYLAAAETATARASNHRDEVMVWCDEE